MLNRRGHLGTMLMVFGALILVGAALYGFATFNDKSGGAEEDLTKLIFGFDFNKRYIENSFKIMVRISAGEVGEGDFEKLFCEKVKEKAKSKRVLWKEKTNFFGKVEEEKCELIDLGDGKFKYEVKDIFVESKVGSNKLKKEFDLSLGFER